MDDLPRLFAWNDWGNREALASLRAAGGGNPPDRARRLLGHLVGTERLWLSRIEGVEKPPAVWPDLTLDECAAGIEEMRGRWAASLASPAPAEARVAYTNSKGQKWENAVSEILTHVVLHGGYHRGQIAAELRAAGHEPAYTDYIEAVRRKKL